MANRNDSDARQHETLPGPGPGSSAPSGGGSRPVEQMVDSAIERIAREKKAAGELARRSPIEAQLARRDARVPTRLRWKGLDVSEEFRQYAERVARGEDLPPFEGRVLAEPNPAFPWGDAAVADAAPPRRGTHPVVWGMAIVVLGLLGWSVALKLDAPAPSALVETVAPLAPPAEAEPKRGPTPPDVVDTPARSARASSSEPTSSEPSLSEASISEASISEASISEASISEAGSAEAVVPPAAEAPLTPLPAATPSPDVRVAAPSPASPSAGASVGVDLSRAGALGQAVGAALAGRSAGSTPAPPSPAANKAVYDDEFGIMASVSPAPAPTTTAATSASAAAGAKSNASVGDLAHAAPPGGSGVRKEPGSESSAKGSLLVETPSF